MTETSVRILGLPVDSPCVSRQTPPNSVPEARWSAQLEIALCAVKSFREPTVVGGQGSRPSEYTGSRHAGHGGLGSITLGIAGTPKLTGSCHSRVPQPLVRARGLTPPTGFMTESIAKHASSKQTHEFHGDASKSSMERH